MLGRVLIFFALLGVLSTVHAGQKNEVKEEPPKPPDSVTLVSYDAAEMPNDTLELQRGDSIFIFDGQLYFRAKAKGREFFISRQQLLNCADTIVVYQYWRLSSQMASSPTSDTSVHKVERRRCTALTKNGTRCKRLALPGSDRCWQHKK
jgi:hypothetical protein